MIRKLKEEDVSEEVIEKCVSVRRNVMKSGMII